MTWKLTALGRLGRLGPMGLATLLVLAVDTVAKEWRNGGGRGVAPEGNAKQSLAMQIPRNLHKASHKQH